MAEGRELEGRKELPDEEGVAVAEDRGVEEGVAAAVVVTKTPASPTGSVGWKLATWRRAQRLRAVVMAVAELDRYSFAYMI